MEGFSLSLPLQVLFGFNGATEALPILAYTAVINDRAQIPLNLLSAYGAISFLPWSFKPVYAFLASSASRNPQLYLYRHRLISCLLLGSGIFIGVTAFIPKGGVMMCFVVGFIRGVLSAFPEFLLDLTLLDEARVASYLCKTSIENYDNHDQSPKKTTWIKSYSSNLELIHRTQGNTLPLANMEEMDMNQNRHDIHKKAFNKISGIFQAQAATARNIGTLASSFLLFILLIFQQYLRKFSFSTHDGTANTENNDELTYNQVTAMLMTTALIPIIGSIIALQYKVGSTYILNQEVNPDAYGTLSSRTAGETKSSWTCSNANITSLSQRITPETPEASPASSLLPPKTTKPSKANVFSMTDIALLVSFQMVIIMFGIKQIILQISSVAWYVTTGILAFVFISITIHASYSAWKREDDNPSLIKRGPAFFLVLKHAMPNISYQWSSYTYFLFRTQPIYLQILSLSGSIMRTFGSKAYEKYIALRFTNLRHVFFFTVVLSTTVSLLYLIPVQFWTNQNMNDMHLSVFFTVLAIGIISTFIGELSFLPSAVLATSSVQLLNEDHLQQVEDMEQDEEDVSGLYTRLNQPNQNKTMEEHNHLLGIEYGAYDACIDFGDQLSSWITLPIITYLSINRGDWSNMGQLIIVCAGLNTIPLLFLCLIPGEGKTR